MWIPAIIGAAAVITAALSPKEYAVKIPDSLVKLFIKWSQATGIPQDILLTWAQRESSFNPATYNPETGAMQRWAAQVVADARWKVNPEYSKAVKVHEMLKSLSAADAAKKAREIGAADKSRAPQDRLWTFGSHGLLQISRMVASEVGAMPYNAPNHKLFDLETNFKAGTLAITSKKNHSLVGFRDREPYDMTDNEWAKVRAAYVMGPGGLKKNPGRAAQISKEFLNTLKQIRGGNLVA